MRAHLIHCSYHKCLTVYFGRIMNSVFNQCLPWSRGYRHYNSHLANFYEGFESHRVAFTWRLDVLVFVGRHLTHRLTETLSVQPVRLAEGEGTP